ncbi:hypothetical protein BC829DRAFT_418793 [Chytridium lagenaria]|nr:hypothetical protein BC829DRAFT_418793 [Chytridium lagenaria]
MYEARKPTLWHTVNPVTLIAPPVSSCLGCRAPLRFQESDANVNVLSTTGLKKEKTGLLRLDQSNYINVTAADIWAVRVPVISKHWTSQLAYQALVSSYQQQKIPSPKANPLFKKAYILRTIIKLHEHRLLREPHLGELELEHWESADLPGAAGSTLREYTRAMEDFCYEVESFLWCMPSYFVKRKCNISISGGWEGHSLGHQVCRIAGCKDPITTPQEGFCKSHYEEFGLVCIIVGCEEKANSEGSDGRTCLNLDHVNMYNSVLLRQTAPSTAQSRILLPPRKRKKQTSTVDDFTTDKDEAERGAFKYRVTRRHLPGIFINVWSCGHIMNVFKMFTFEQTGELLPGISHTYESIGRYPTFTFFDKACRFIPSVKHAIDAVDNPIMANTFRRVIDEVVWLVDKFHFKSHNDERCKELFNPELDEIAFPELGRWNTQAAEQANAWLQRVANVRLITLVKA